MIEATPLGATLAKLRAKHGADLGIRLDNLRSVQRQEIADVAYEHGPLVIMEELGVPIASLERALRDCGYEQCTGECEAWFGALELDDHKHCQDCSTAGEFYERQRQMKAAAEREEWMRLVALHVGIEELTDELRERIGAILALGYNRSEDAAAQLRAYLTSVESVEPTKG